VERTLSWINRNRRLAVRYERRDDNIHQAFLELGCALYLLEPRSTVVLGALRVPYIPSSLGLPTLVGSFALGVAGRKEDSFDPPLQL
jgi:hypothetical protein